MDGLPIIRQGHIAYWAWSWLVVAKAGTTCKDDQ